ncbi:hypothetical protein IMSAG013_00346 [Clostridiales bacterium]|nr:hypothetical protein IMSAG013_00346 [Clostridiales bacterium]
MKKNRPNWAVLLYKTGIFADTLINAELFWEENCGSLYRKTMSGFR